MAKQKKPKLEGSLDIPEGIEVSITGSSIKVKGKGGEIEKKLANPRIKMELKDKKVIITALKNSKREKKVIGTFKAHIKNMIQGCAKPYVYTLKICSGHFPMTVSLNKDELVVKNFFGEKVPRKLSLKKGVNVKVGGDLINVESADKEACGQVAAEIEKITQRTAYDRRIFQDGIYIIKKDEKEIK